MPELLPAGSPIRRPAGRRVCAPNRGLSQLAASFIGFLCQGIRRAPVISSRCRLISAPRGIAPGRREHTGRGLSPRRPDAHCYYPYIRIVSINPCTCRRIDIRSSLCQYRYRIVFRSRRTPCRRPGSLCGSQGTRGDPGDRTLRGTGEGRAGTPCRSICEIFTVSLPMEAGSP